MFSPSLSDYIDPEVFYPSIYRRPSDLRMPRVDSFEFRLALSRETKLVSLKSKYPVPMQFLLPAAIALGDLLLVNKGEKNFIREHFLGADDPLQVQAPSSGPWSGPWLGSSKTVSRYGTSSVREMCIVCTRPHLLGRRTLVPEATVTGSTQSTKHRQTRLTQLLVHQYPFSYIRCSDKI